MWRWVQAEPGQRILGSNWPMTSVIFLFLVEHVDSVLRCIDTKLFRDVENEDSIWTGGHREYIVNDFHNLTDLLLATWYTRSTSWMIIECGDSCAC